MEWHELNVILLPLLLGVIADRLWGDPEWLPHPVVGFGKIIAWGEKTLNNGDRRQLKGGLFSIILIAATFLLSGLLLNALERWNTVAFILAASVLVFGCLAGKTLIREVREVFLAVNRSTEAGRKQVARIVGRDTSALTPQQIRTAALETLAENLSDGVVAPLFWYLLLGVPGMLAYKMVNTLDSMIGYKNERYKEFGCWAAWIDDFANYVPARLTAVIMVFVAGSPRLLTFVARHGTQHASPNSGYPEAALAGILNCRFGGPNYYSGEMVNKPYIGSNPKPLTTEDMERSVTINSRTELAMVAVMVLLGVCICLSGNVIYLLN